MDDREKLVELIQDGIRKGLRAIGDDRLDYSFEVIADHLIANGVTVQNPARPLEEWDEDYGDVLWWVFPIEEPPYIGSPLDLAWPGYHTHWTSIEVPKPPKEDE